MRLYTQMEFFFPRSTTQARLFLSFCASSSVYWCFVGTESYPGYMAINSNGEKGCESPIRLWVTRWLLIFFGSCVPVWVVSSLCPSRSIWYAPVARLYCFWLIGEHQREYYMLSEWDMSGLMFKRGRYTGIVDLFICNTRNEDSLIMINEAGIATCNSRL